VNFTTHYTTLTATPLYHFVLVKATLVSCVAIEVLSKYWKSHQFGEDIDITRESRDAATVQTKPSQI